MRAAEDPEFVRFAKSSTLLLAAYIGLICGVIEGLEGVILWNRTISAIYLMAFAELVVFVVLAFLLSLVVGVVRKELTERSTVFLFTWLSTFDIVTSAFTRPWRRQVIFVIVTCTLAADLFARLHRRYGE